MDRNAAAAAARPTPRPSNGQRQLPAAEFKTMERIEEIQNRLALVREWIVGLAENGAVDDDAAAGAVNDLFDARDLLSALLKRFERA